MLSRNSYRREDVDACRARVAAQVAAYRHLVATARAQAGSAEALESALADFGPEFFNNMVMTLDGAFVHRARGMEGKDGNPLSEVRVVCESLTLSGGVLAADKQIELEPDASILGDEVGDRISLGEEQFARLAEAFFAEIERKFPEKL